MDTSEDSDNFISADEDGFDSEQESDNVTSTTSTVTINPKPDSPAANVVKNAKDKVDSTCDSEVCKTTESVGTMSVLDASKLENNSEDIDNCSKSGEENLTLQSKCKESTTEVEHDSEIRNISNLEILKTSISEKIDTLELVSNEKRSSNDSLFKSEKFLNEISVSDSQGNDVPNMNLAVSITENENKLTSSSSIKSPAEATKNQDTLTRETIETVEDGWSTDGWDTNWDNNSTPIDVQCTEISTEIVNKTNEDESNAGWSGSDSWEWNETPATIEIKQSDKKTADTIKQNVGESTTDDNMWENDEWEPVDQDPDESGDQISSAWGRWDTWGISSVLNTVHQGLSSAIGVPEPEQLAQMHKEKASSNNEAEMQSTADFGESRTRPGFGISNLVSGVTQITKLVETTSTKVISGGLDTLETIGKKTIEKLQENDPGLKRKKAYLKLEPNKPILSEILREAKESNVNDVVHSEPVRRVSYDASFDDYQGLVHLEALEMLSKQCSIKLKSIRNALSAGELRELQETLEQVEELCELTADDADDHSDVDSSEKQVQTLVGQIESAINDVGVQISLDKACKMMNEARTWVQLETNTNLVLGKCVDTLALFTAAVMEQYHKCGELLLVKQHRSTADEADSLVQLTTSLCSLLNILTGLFTEKIKREQCENESEWLTTIFYESANSNTYIHEAFHFLVPILQIGAT